MPTRSTPAPLAASLVAIFVASMPPHVCVNEILISPTWNRGFVTPTIL